MPMHSLKNTASRWQQWLFIGALALQMLVACSSIVLLTSVRIVATGESIWSKSLATAVTHLDDYAQRGLAQDLEAFTTSIQAPQELQQARHLLASPPTDGEQLHQHLLAAGLHEADAQIARYVLAFVWQWPAIQNTQATWQESDRSLQALLHTSKEIQSAYASSPPPSSAQIAQWRQQLTPVHTEAKSLAAQFSDDLTTLGRQLSIWLLGINIGTAVLLCLLHWLSVAHAHKESQHANRALENERMRSGVTLAALQDGVLTLDSQQHVRYANPAASLLIDLPLNKLLGQPIRDVLPCAAFCLAEPPRALPAPGTPPPRDDQVHWIEREGTDSKAIRLSITPQIGRAHV